MCGDGTNDVGALKHAHVGVSILSNTSMKRKKIKLENVLPAPGSIVPPSAAGAAVTNNAIQNRIRGNNERAASARERALARHREQTQSLLNSIEEDQVQLVKLGDASIAAPFTSKTSSINCGRQILENIHFRFMFFFLVFTFSFSFSLIKFRIFSDYFFVFSSIFSVSHNQAGSMYARHHLTNV